MNAFKLFCKELAAIGSNRKILIPVVAVLLIPVLYSAMFLWAFWDPYAHMDRLPVAVVNMDQGAAFNGERLEIGKDLVEKLKENPRFNWKFVSAEEAWEGLKANRYYMMIEIPRDFSERATTALEENPQPLEIRFIPNESYNFLASQIGESAMERIKNELSAHLTEKYVEVIVDRFSALSEGLEQVSEGAASLKDHMGSLAQGSLSLSEGIHSALQGSSELEKGLVEIEKGSERLASGLDQLSSGNARLLAGAQKTRDGLLQLKEGTARSLGGMMQLETAASQLVKGIQQFAHQHPELAQNPGFAALEQNLQILSQGIQEMRAGQERLADGAKQVLDGQNRLLAGMEQLNRKLNEAGAGAEQLHQGIRAAADGSRALRQGLVQLASGAERLADGTQRLDQGSLGLKDGLFTLKQGAQTLSEKLAKTTQPAPEVGEAEKLSMLAAPVKLTTEEWNQVPNYGTGFAPYFLSLGLYVGALILTIVLPVRKLAESPKSPFSGFVAKFLVFILIGIGQALVADLVLLYGLKIEVESVWLFILFSICTSMAFMALIQFLVTTLDHPGRFVAIVLLILQLTSCAGTFPLEVIPETLQAIHPWLPMTYSVAGFKAVISSGGFGMMWHNAAILLLFAVLSAMGTLVAFIRMNRARTQTAQNSLEV